MTHRKSKSKRPAVSPKQIGEVTVSESFIQENVPPPSNKTKGTALDRMEQPQPNECVMEKPACNATDTLHDSTKRLALNKRPRPNDTDEGSRHRNKRSKANGNAGSPYCTEKAEDITRQATTSALSIQGADTNNSSTNQALPAEVQHLQNKYDFTTMSILSSSKIEQKVRNVLLRVSKFDFADVKAKPGIVVLHAKADVAGKMVSIVEIAKQEIQKEKRGWYQYSKLHGEIMQLKEKQPKRSGGGKTLAEWSMEKSNTKAAAEGGQKTSDSAEEGQKEKEAVNDEDGEMEDAFETMVIPTGERNHAEDRKKVRAIPIMTIYLARVPVPGLKELYGYASNIIF